MKRVFVLGLAMVLVIACQKEDDTSSRGTFPKILPLTYMPLNVGDLLRTFFL